MERENLTEGYSRERRTVEQEMLYRQIKECCGNCVGWFYGWTRLLYMRSIDGRDPNRYMQMEVQEFHAHVRACEAAMRESEAVDSCIAGLEATWHKDWRNPADTRFTADEKARKMAELRRLYGG